MPYPGLRVRDAQDLGRPQLVDEELGRLGQCALPEGLDGLQLVLRGRRRVRRQRHRRARCCLGCVAIALAAGGGTCAARTVTFACLGRVSLRFALDGTYIGSKTAASRHTLFSALYRQCQYVSRPGFRTATMSSFLRTARPGGRVVGNRLTPT